MVAELRGSAAWEFWLPLGALRVNENVPMGDEVFFKSKRSSSSGPSRRAPGTLSPDSPERAPSIKYFSSTMTWTVGSRIRTEPRQREAAPMQSPNQGEDFLENFPSRAESYQIFFPGFRVHVRGFRD